MENENQITIKQAVLEVYNRMPNKFYLSSMIQPVRTLVGDHRKPYDSSIARKLRILNQRGIIHYTASNTGIYTKMEIL
jgi:hypothetical protein